MTFFFKYRIFFSLSGMKHNNIPKDEMMHGKASDLFLQNLSQSQFFNYFRLSWDNDYTHNSINKQSG
jgi:hypothetical protein